MTTLTEIEAATEALSIAQKQELLIFIAAQLRDSSQPLPQPRSFAPEQISQWIADDERDAKNLNCK